jgi:hypothetical protein
MLTPMSPSLSPPPDRSSAGRAAGFCALPLFGGFYTVAALLLVDESGNRHFIVKRKIEVFAGKTARFVKCIIRVDDIRVVFL